MDGQTRIMGHINKPAFHTVSQSVNKDLCFSGETLYTSIQSSAAAEFVHKPKGLFCYKMNDGNVRQLTMNEYEQICSTYSWEVAQHVVGPDIKLMLWRKREREGECMSTIHG